MTVCARGEVVIEAERVPDLVRRQLADPREAQLHRVVWRAGPGLLGAGQPLEDQPVLPHAKRAERDVALDHLAGARVDDPAAVGPAARRPVRPLDHVVAHVERVRARRQHLHMEPGHESGQLERPGPPRSALDHRAPDRLGNPRIHVVHDRLLHVGVDHRGIHQLEAVAHQQAHVEVGADRARIVGEQHSIRAAARIPAARPVARIGEADQRLVLDDRDRGRGRSRLAHLAPGRLAGKGEHGLELEIVREALALGGLERAALLVEREAALPRPLERGGDPVRIADDQ
jgi:hypothetical protein